MKYKVIINGVSPDSQSDKIFQVSYTLIDDASKEIFSKTFLLNLVETYPNIEKELTKSVKAELVKKADIDIKIFDINAALNNFEIEVP